jgi:hypothetical protein
MATAGLKGGEAPDVMVMTRVAALAAIALIVDETGVPVFEATDLDRLLSSEVGEEEQELIDAAGGALGGSKRGEASGSAGESVSLSS